MSERIEQAIGTDVRFECRIKANPLVSHYWMKDGRVIENTSQQQQQQQQQQDDEEEEQDQIAKIDSKYELTTYNKFEIDYLTVNILLVKNLTKKDFGTYQCIAVNAYNTSKINIELKQRHHSLATNKMSASRILIFSNLNKDYKSSNNRKQQQQEEEDVTISTTPSSSSSYLFTKHLFYSTPKLARKTALNNTNSKIKYNKATK